MAVQVDSFSGFPNARNDKFRICLFFYNSFLRFFCARSQGKLLVKLINRECGQSSYDMVKAFLGPARAGFYQIFAGLYGNSLTKKYDPQGEDKYTERIVRMIESGQL